MNFQLFTKVTEPVEVHFQLNRDNFKYRNYDYAIGRFMSVDPLAEKYAYNGVYNFSENRVLDARELEGLEGVDFRMKLNEAVHNAPKMNMSVSEYMDKSSVSNLTNNHYNSLSKNQKLIINGTTNVVSGVIGTIETAIYIIGSEGAGAALGGTVALELSLEQMAIGFTQITDVVENGQSTNENLHSKNTIPELIAGEQNSKNADKIDKAASLITIPLTGGINVKPKNFFEVMDVANDAYNVNNNFIIPFVSHVTNRNNNTNNENSSNNNDNNNSDKEDKKGITIQQ